MKKDMIQYEWVKGEMYENRILDFLTDVDDVIIPKLSERVHLEEYAKKLACKAETLFARYENNDIGACSIYCNTEIAYISSIAVKKAFASMHIGSEIILNAKKKSCFCGCKCIRLDVFKENDNAIRFYKKNGFYKLAESEDWLTMEWRCCDER